MGSKAAVQMYTLRDETKTEAEFADSLKKISDIGYEAVQLSAVGCMNGDDPEVDATQGRKMLDDHGLKCIATHRDWDDLENETQREVDFHQTLGCTYTAIGGIPGPYREKGAEGFREFVKDSAEPIARLKEAGITWGYHNHAHEFVRYAAGPKTWYDIFIDEGGPDFTLELDTYWAVHAGADPIAIFDRCHGRVPVIHVKDKEVVNNEPIMSPVGEGNLNWDGIIDSCKRAGVEWYAVEQDRCYRDAFDCLKSSFEFLVSKGV
jgi:sugar phosphate isomerase/epimerase